MRLKPCPFCGGKAQFRENHANSRYPHFVECTGCMARTEGSAFRNDEYNKQQWNTRHSTPIEAQYQEALRELVRPSGDGRYFRAGYRDDDVTDVVKHLLE